MSRIESYRRKQFAKKILIYIICIVALLAVMVTVGLNTIIKSSLYISSLISPGKKEEETAPEQNFFGSLHIDDIPEATNSAEFVVRGSVTDFTLIEFYINDEKVKELSVEESPSFSETIGDLEKGVSNVYVKAILEDPKHEKISAVYNVVYSDEKPELEISEPKDNSKTSRADITVEGTTDKEITIKINQSPVIVNAQGNFKFSLRLKEGENKVEVTAEDKSGNVEKKTVTVTYQKDE